MKSILITGCSSGIGLHVAQDLHKQGYRVFAGVRKSEDLQRLIDLGLTDSLLIDVDDTDSIKKAVRKVRLTTDGQLDVLFNNAGFVLAGAIEDLSREAMQQQFSTNVFGSMELIREVLPMMRRQGHGRIIQNSSILGVMTMPFRGAYNASKFAIEGFIDTLRQELSDTDIKVISLQPGPISSSLRNNAKQAFTSHIDVDNSIHKMRYHAMQAYFNREEKRAGLTQSPDIVTKKLLHAIESKHPKAKYKIGGPAYLMGFCKWLLPTKWMDALCCYAVSDEFKAQ